VQLAYDVKALHAEGKSYREIANKLGVSHMKVSRIIKGS
jgi:DNA-binding CsgD family transcriptional regulator